MVIHPLADHRRELPIDRLGTTLPAAPGFQLVISYNPGYQSVLKNLKESTRQRFIALELGFPPAETETEVVAHEARVDDETARSLVKLANAIRNLDGSPLREVASTRLLILAGGLVAEGLSLRSAVQSAVVQALSDDRTSSAPSVNSSTPSCPGSDALPDPGTPDRFRLLATYIARRSVASRRRRPASARTPTVGSSSSRRALQPRSSDARCGSSAHFSLRGVSIRVWSRRCGRVPRWPGATWHSRGTESSPNSRVKSPLRRVRGPRLPTSLLKWQGAERMSLTHPSGLVSSSPPGC